MKKLIALGMVALLVGCGSLKTAGVDAAKSAALEAVKKLEAQLVPGPAQSSDVRALVFALDGFASAAKTAGVGTDAQRAEVTSLAAELSQKAFGAYPVPPAKGDEPASCGLDKDTLKNLLAKMRDAVNAVK